MLGKIIAIEDESVLLKLNIELDKFQNLVNLYVVMEDNEDVLVGEIVKIMEEDIAYINLLGEIVKDKFIVGVIKKPSFSATVKLVSKEKIPMIISVAKPEEKTNMYVGTSPIYDDVKIGFNINQFFSNHFSVLGSTGSGKSWGVANLIQNIFNTEKAIAYRANIFIFDAYGEYQAAFKNISQKAPEVSFKTYTTNPKNKKDLLRIPLWLLSIDDIALILNVDSQVQMPIIEKTLSLVNIFAREDKRVKKEKNDIIARTLLDILSSGKSSSQIRDQIFSILTKYNTDDLNLEATIYQPGYVRTLKQCLIIDSNGKIREMELLTKFISDFLDNSIEPSLPDGTFEYTLKDLSHALDFALISEGTLTSEKIYDDVNILKVRLQTLINSEKAEYFDYPEYINIDDYIKQLLSVDGKKAQIINFNINYVDDRFAKTITKIYSKLLFDYAKNLEKRASLPFHIILEEAHRYVQNDSDKRTIGYNIFDRIATEGRKYGVLLGLITQRLSDLSETAISQCNNFLIFKTFHPKDVRYIEEIVPYINDEVVRKLKVLKPGTCIVFGSAFEIPVLVKMEKPNPEPSSDNCDVSENWFVNRK